MSAFIVVQGNEADLYTQAEVDALLAVVEQRLTDLENSVAGFVTGLNGTAKLWTGTRVEFDALASVDTDTAYLVVEPAPGP